MTVRVIMGLGVWCVWVVVEGTTLLLASYADGRRVGVADYTAIAGMSAALGSGLARSEL
jgi:hypothetical protein